MYLYSLQISDFKQGKTFKLTKLNQLHGNHCNLVTGGDAFQTLVTGTRHPVFLVINQLKRLILQLELINGN